MNRCNKVTFRDENGHYICGGGLLFYDDYGIWVIKEARLKEGLCFIEPGGTFEVADSHIKNTIVREFLEETYYAFKFSISDLKDLFDKNKVHAEYSIYDNRGHPNWIVYMIHTDDCPTIELNSDKFDKYRKYAIETTKHNDHERYYYNSISLVYLTFKDIDTKKDIYYNYRLEQILKKIPRKY